MPMYSIWIRILLHQNQCIFVSLVSGTDRCMWKANLMIYSIIWVSLNSSQRAYYEYRRFISQKININIILMKIRGRDVSVKFWYFYSKGRRFDTWPGRLIQKKNHENKIFLSYEPTPMVLHSRLALL